MDENQKKFSLYVFLSTFSRNLIEVFIPVILYKFGYSLKEVLIYYLLVNAFSLLISHPCVLIANKYGNKTLAIVGIISFVISQILLNFISRSSIYILILAFSYALYRRGYWMSRRFYNMKIIKKDKISTTYSIIAVINQLGVIFSTFIGAVLLDYVGINVLTVIAILFFLASVIPLYKLNFHSENINKKIELKNTLKKIPKRDLYLFGTYELKNVVTFLFALYIFIYIKDNYQAIGILNMLTNIALMIFTYLFGKRLDKSNKNFLGVSIFLTVIAYVLKANTTTYLLLLVSFIEGFISKMHEITINNHLYSLSKKFEYNNLNFVYELTQNVFRTVVVLAFVLFTFDLKTMIYICLAIIFIGIFFKFKNVETDDYVNDESHLKEKKG